MKNRTNQIDRLDSEGLQFHQRVRHAYLKLAEENPDRIIKIDARKRLDMRGVNYETYFSDRSRQRLKSFGQ